MNKKNIMKASAIALSFCMLTSSLPATNVTAAAKPKLNKKNITVTVGKKVKLKVKNAGKKKISWKSSNKKIATVSKKGVVKAKKIGKTIVTAKIGKKAYKCRVTVTGGLNKTSVKLNKGASTTLKFNGTKKTVKWRSSNSSVVSVKQTGRGKAKITAKKAGNAKIIAKANGKTYTCKVTVNGNKNNGGSAKEKEKARRKELEKQIDVKLNNAVKEVTTPQMKPQEKALKLALYVCDNLGHYYGKYWAESDVDSIRCLEGGKGTELGYAEVYGSLLDKVGIENFWVPSNCGGLRTKLKIDGQWYNVDVYNMDTLPVYSAAHYDGKGGGYIGESGLHYAYFMFSDHEAFKYHPQLYKETSANNKKDYPDATSTRFDFLELTYNKAKADDFSKLDLTKAHPPLESPANFSDGEYLAPYNPWVTGEWVNY